MKSLRNSTVSISAVSSFLAAFIRIRLQRWQESDGTLWLATRPAAAPAPQPGNAPIYTPTTTVFGAALGGIFAKDNKSVLKAV